MKRVAVGVVVVRIEHAVGKLALPADHVLERERALAGVELGLVQPRAAVDVVDHAVHPAFQGVDLHQLALALVADALHLDRLGLLGFLEAQVGRRIGVVVDGAVEQQPLFVGGEGHRGDAVQRHLLAFCALVERHAVDQLLLPALFVPQVHDDVAHSITVVQHHLAVVGVVGHGVRAPLAGVQLDQLAGRQVAAVGGLDGLGARFGVEVDDGRPCGRTA